MPRMLPALFLTICLALPACNGIPPPAQDCRTTGCDPGFVCEEEGGTYRCVPAPVTEPPIAMLLRNNGTGQLVDLDGKEVEFVGVASCCAPIVVEGEEEVRRPTKILVAGKELLTGWPMPFEKQYRDYCNELTGGKCNFYIGRPGPWFADETAEPEWIEWGGAYVRLSDGRADLAMFNQPFWDESTRRVNNTCLESSWILMGAFDNWWWRHGDEMPNPMRPRWNVQGYDFRVGKGRIIPGSFRALYLKKFVEEYGPYPCILWADGNEISVGPYDDEFTTSMRDLIREYEQTVGGGMVHMFATEGPDSVAADRVDMVIRHQQVAISAPIFDKPSFVNEFNPRPAFNSDQMFKMYCDGVRAGTYVFAWRHTMDQSEYEDALRRMAAGCGIVPPPSGCKDVESRLVSVGACTGETFRDEVKRATDALGDLTGGDPQTNLKILAAKTVEQNPGLCAFGGIEAIFIQRPDKLWVENHAVFFGDGGWTGNGFGKIIGCHQELVASACGSPTPPPLHHFRGPKEKSCSGSQCCDATPYVCDQAYCREIGFTDGRGCCSVRTEGAVDREACERLVLGGDAVWTSSTGGTQLCNENHLRAKCPGGCAWIQVSNVAGTISNRKTF